MILKEENGNEVYSDGNETELRMLEIAKQYPEDMAQDFIADNSEYTINNTFSSVRENILNWYPFKSNCTILEIGAGMGSITGLLCNKAKSVTAVEMNSMRAEIIKTRYADRKNLVVIAQNIENLDKSLKFDYVVMIGVLEYSEVFFDIKDPFKYMLEIVKSHLNEDGIVLCAIENRFGLKYWCGASEDHLQEPFIGINGYSEERTPKTFSKYELSQLFDSAGFANKRFYYVLPDYRFPRAIYTDDYLPFPQDIDNIPFTYSKGSLLHSKEQVLYSQIIKNNAFDFFSNSYLIEASTNKLDVYKVKFASTRGEVKKEYRCITSIDNENRVIKYPAHSKSKNHIEKIYDNYLYLKDKGIKQIDQSYDNNRLLSQFVPYKRADIAFEEALIADDLKPIYCLIDRLKESLIKSSDFEMEKNILVDLGYIDKGEYKGAVLKHGFVDMTFYNAFIVDGELVFFDQEWKIENIPLDFILYYAIKIAYNRAKTIHKIQIKDLLDYAGITGFYSEFDTLESYIWSEVFYRTGDVYGKDGYCNQYSDNLTLDFKLNCFNQELANKQLHIDQLMESERFLQGEVQSKAGHIEQLIESERLLHGEVESKAGHIEQLMETERSLNRRLSEQKENLENLNIALNNKTGHIEQLLLSERRLNSDINGILNSRTWKLASKISSISRKIFPLYSKRRLFAKLLFKFLSHPFRFISRITPKRIGLFFHVLKTEGTPGVSMRINNQMADKKIPQYSQKISVLENSDSQKDINDYEPIVFKKESKPVVSIIIPVFNQFNYTYNCLKSIYNYSGDKVSYEIIIANDCSDDLTKHIKKIISNINVVTTQSNLRFLKNCNNAAKYAKGKYILFLNNDTQVQENWLLPLVELIEKDDTVGAVGSKLVFENGLLQEAGGILWNDASGWNYGRMGDPALPEFNYVKEVDYISGAALMVRKSIWEKLGGFDGNFAPAYCEDSDLCFSIRKIGYKVMYQPASVVVHFEGITNGIDISEGQKQYQVINQNKFFEKWKDVLENEHSPNGKDVFLARDRSGNKKLLLMVDHYVPQFDKDAGSRTVFQYIKLFVNLGFNVKFIGDNFYKHEPYTAILEQMGVEVLYGVYYAQNWKTWVEVNGKYIDYVFLNRPHIAVNYIDEVKEHTNAKIFYYGHDLHFLREQREYKIRKDNALLKSFEKWKKIELELMSKADISYYPSEIEVHEIKKQNPSMNVKAIPAYLFDIQQKNERNIKNTKDIMFIGGFQHKPNVDGVLWYVKDIFPILNKKRPEIKTYILGSNAPEEILRLNSENIVITGFVTDEQLTDYYRNCRLSVVPLRYGAGVKGKVVEAMYNQIPVVTTSVGAEGINGAENCLFIKDDPMAFADEIISLYDDLELLSEISRKEIDVVNESFTTDAAIRAIADDFNL